MTKKTSWPEYFRRITGGASGADISRKTAIPPSTISRWLNGATKPTLSNLEALAKAYDFDREEASRVIDAYKPVKGPIDFVLAEPVAVEFERNASRIEVLRHYSDLELAHEFVRRIDEKDSIEEPRPLPSVEKSNVTELRPRNVQGPGHTQQEAAFESTIAHEEDTDDNYE